MLILRYVVCDADAACWLFQKDTKQLDPKVSKVTFFCGTKIVKMNCRTEDAVEYFSQATEFIIL